MHPSWVRVICSAGEAEASAIKGRRMIGNIWHRRRASIPSRAVVAVAICLTGCGQLGHPVSFDGAISAAEAGDVDRLRSEIRRLEKGPVGDCVAYSFFDLLQSVATYQASSKTRDDASELLSTTGSSIAGGPSPGGRVGWHVRRCGSEKTDAAFSAVLPKLNLVLDAVEGEACSAIFDLGVDPQIAVDIALGDDRPNFGKARPFWCHGQSRASQSDISAYVQSLNYASIDPGRLVDCKVGISDGVLREAYSKDLKSLGRPKTISVGADGIRADWDHGYSLFVGVNPSMIRRTQGAFPSLGLRKMVSENDGSYFTEGAANAVRHACLSEGEITRIVINVADELPPVPWAPH